MSSNGPTAVESQSNHSRMEVETILFYFIYLSVCLSVRHGLSVRLSIRPSVRQSVRSFVHSFIRLMISQVTYFVFNLVCLPVNRVTKNY